MNKLKDIKVGEGVNDRIEWIEFDKIKTELLEIDDLILERKQFWDQLETECVKDCCGFSAYSFFPEDIEKAKSTETNFDLYMDEIIQYVSQSTLEILISKYMNQLVHKRTFLELMIHIKEI